MRGRFSFSILALFTCFSSYSDDARQSLSVLFEPAVAIIPPRTSNQPIQLPDLVFSLQAEAQCPTTDATASVSISIADSSISIVTTDNNAFAEQLNVPGKQLAPVVATDFCLEDKANVVQRLELKGTLSAQLSLRCQGENSETISYATTPLDVILECSAEQ
jgi:hypothetical protein